MNVNKLDPLTVQKDTWTMGEALAFWVEYTAKVKRPQKWTDMVSMHCHSMVVFQNLSPVDCFQIVVISEGAANHLLSSKWEDGGNG